MSRDSAKYDFTKTNHEIIKMIKSIAGFSDLMDDAIETGTQEEIKALVQGISDIKEKFDGFELNLWNFIKELTDAEETIEVDGEEKIVIEVKEAEDGNGVEI